MNLKIVFQKLNFQGQIQEFLKGVILYKGCFADFISFSSISHENEIIWSHLDQIISFSYIFKNAGGEGFERTP